MKSNNIKNVLCFFIIAISVLFINNISAQPYFFYTQEQNDSNIEDVYRINLSTGSDELFIKDAGRLNGILWNSSQTRLYVIQRFATIDIYNLEDTTKVFRIENDAQSVANIHDSHRTNKLLIDYGTADDESYKYTVIYNRTTYESLDTIDFRDLFLSYDENIIYRNNGSKEGVFFSAFNLNNNTFLYENQKITNLKSDRIYFGLDYSNKGRALFLKADSAQFNKQYMFICHPDSGLFLNPTSVPSEMFNTHLSANNDFIILQKIDWMSNPQIHTGEIHIYNAITGVKISDLFLPPNGEVLVFDNFPNMFYYFNRTDHSVVPIDLTTLEYSESGLPAKLTDSQGNLLTGGTLQYYEGVWKDAIDNGNGTFIVQTDRSTISLKMNYLGGWQQFNNVPSVDGSDTVVFQTVKAVVQLNDSQGNLHDGGAASFYAKSWQEIGTTVNGETSIELLPKEYSFRMSYLGGSIDKKQNIGEDSLIVFQTVKAAVQLKDSQDNLFDGGTAQFYAKSWQEIGTTVNGEVTKELLPKEYSFRMTYNNIGNDKKQNIADNVVVVFSTIPVTVSVKNSNGDIILGAEVQYYSKQWNVIGNTDSSGEITTEMLPKNITFRVKYNSQTTDKQQNTAENSLVEFIVE